MTLDEMQADVDAQEAKERERLGSLWGVLRSQLGTRSVQGIRAMAGAAGFDVSRVPATAEANSGMGSRAEVLPAIDALFKEMGGEAKSRVLTALANRLLETPETVAQTTKLLSEQGLAVVDGRLELSQRSDADKDHLTGLLNRRAFDSDLPKAIGRMPQGGRLSMLAFDIDKFKSVNDDHGGHATGDEALVAVARIASEAVFGKGQLFRLGGDEFAALLPNYTQHEALALAERIRRAVNESKLTSRALTLSLSIGVAEFPAHGADADSLKKSADTAAYDAKNLGRNLARMFGEGAASAGTPSVIERKLPMPGGLTGEQQMAIRKHYFTNGYATCPTDGAKLRVQGTTGMGQQTESIHVSCPLCGLSAGLD